MAEFIINGKKIELDTRKTYLDFHWENKTGQLATVNLEAMLTEVQSGKIPVDNKLREVMQYLQRWQTDAPRKRFYRDLRRNGSCVLTSDALFEQDGGEKTIDGLENTGVFAAYFLKEVYGKK
jgi:hypothetical protein